MSEIKLGFPKNRCPFCGKQAWNSEREQDIAFMITISTKENIKDNEEYLNFLRQFKDNPLDIRTMLKKGEIVHGIHAIVCQHCKKAIWVLFETYLGKNGLEWDRTYFESGKKEVVEKLHEEIDKNHIRLMQYVLDHVELCLT